MEIRIYTMPQTAEETFACIGITYRATDVNYTVAFTEIGEFEFKLPLNDEYIAEFVKGRIVLINNDFWGMIKELDYRSAVSSDFLTVRGYDLKCILASRVVVPSDYISTSGTAGYDVVTGSTEYCVKHYITNNMIYPANLARKIEHFFLLPNQNRGRADDKYQARFNGVDQVSIELLTAENMGHAVKLDLTEKELQYDILCGTDRTAGQSDYSRVIFEIQRKNILDINYAESEKGYKNTFYTTLSGAKFADEALTQTYYENDVSVSGIRRIETWMELNATVNSASETYDELKRLAQLEMPKSAEVKTFVCTVRNDAGYQEKWQVGDYVTIRWRELGITMDIQITAVNIAAASGAVQQTVRFGKRET